MKIDVDGRRQFGERRLGSPVLFLCDANVDVAIWAKGGLGVQPRCRPALDDQSFDARRRKRAHDLGELELVNRRLERVQAVGIPELVPDL